MKKTALTLGLFSLVMVATSFITPEKTNTSISANSNVILDIDGGQGRVVRKSDYAFETSKHLNSEVSRLSSFTLDSQLTKNKVKVD